LTAPTRATAPTTVAFTHDHSLRYSHMLSTLTKDHIRPLIELNDQVNKLTAQEREINSTRIVVLGDQSHGKSSLLEALSGVDLPRGEDIKTRVPLVMQLRKCPDGDEECAYISRAGVSPVKIALREVAARVDEFTAAIAGDDKAVKDEPINLKVLRHDQDDMTLVDLPGITRVAREGQGGDGKQLEGMILGMCRKYAEPPESIILNVASAMVDFSTSASLQLSQELDPEGRRTLLCVTKIDQHKESGLAKKIRAAVDTMKLRAELIFAVRNRKQEENDQALSLAKARQLETECIASDIELTEGAELHGYGLGILHLSQQLVKIQLQRIIETLPATAKAIRRKLDELQRRLAEIGHPMEDEQACKLKAMMLADECHEALCKEREGRAQQATGAATSEGEVIEIELCVHDMLKARSEYPCSKRPGNERVIMADGLNVSLSIYPNGTTVNPAPHYMDVCISINAFPPGVKSVSMDSTIDLCCKNANEDLIKSEQLDHVWDKTQGWGPSPFMMGAEMGKLKGAYILRATIFVKQYTADEGSLLKRLWCATINELDTGLVTAVDKVHANRKFFSKEFGMKLGAAARARSGSNCMPGAINHEVPIEILRDLRKGLPSVAQRYVTVFSEVTDEKVKDIIGSSVDSKMHPKLMRLMLATASSVLEHHTELALKESGRMLQWEDRVTHTSNHYYMDIVQQLRREILKDDQSEEVWMTKPPYLKHLDFSKLSKQSNAEQELVDLQIKTFAYWKMMKKRLVDYLQLSTRANLSADFVDALRKAFRESIEHASDMTALMAPDDSLGRERSSLSRRITDLKEADHLLKAAETTFDLSGNITVSAGFKRKESTSA